MKILIIQLSRMGDVIQTLPLLKSLKTNHPDSEISFLGFREFTIIIKDTLFIDFFVNIDSKYADCICNFSDEKINKINEILKIDRLQGKFDLLINLTHNKGSALLSQIINSGKKIGRIYEINNNDDVKLLNDYTKYLFTLSHNRKENLFNLQDIYIGMGEGIHSQQKALFPVSKDMLSRAEKILNQNGYIKNNILICLQIGANRLNKTWGIENFISLAKKLSDIKNIQVAFIGSNREKMFFEENLKKIDLPIIDLMGKTEINDLPSILKISKLLISNDSGPIHVASSVGSHTAGIYFGAVYFAETSPYSDKHISIQSETGCSPCVEGCSNITCLDSLNVERVFNVVSDYVNYLNDHSDTADFQKNYNYNNFYVYKTVFSSNGTLNYIPLSKNISGNFIKGFIQKILWENVFLISKDKEYIRLILNFIKKNDYGIEFEKILEQYKLQYLILQSKYENLIKTAEDLNLIDDKSRNLLNESILNFENYIQNSKDSLIKYFHIYEMMNIEDSNDKSKLDQLLIKYKKIFSIINDFSENITI